jgi:hypothetical protein
MHDLTPDVRCRICQTQSQAGPPVRLQMEHEMKSLPVAVIADPISGHLFFLPFATPTLRTAMSWQRSLDDLPAHRWLRGFVLRVIQTL